MNDWIARYEEGFVTADGRSVTVADEVHLEQPWRTPTDARAHWATRPDLTGADVGRYRNGLQQTHDVRSHGEFAALGVVAIWRRVSFELSANVRRS